MGERSKGKKSEAEERTLEEVMLMTKKMLESVLEKPRPSTKILSRPPFRFIFDVIMNLMKLIEKKRKESGKNVEFLEKYLLEQDYVSENIKDKETKIAFLSRIVKFLEGDFGMTLDVRLSKIIAGQECVKTNLFIQQLIECYQRTKEVLDKAGVKKADSRDTQSVGSSKASKRSNATGASSRNGSNRSRRRESRSTDDLFQIADGNVDTTIKILGKLVSKPKMSEKYLSRPPFRYIHDIISELNRKAGFLDGLLDEAELDAKKITGKTEKLEYVSKLAAFVAQCFDQQEIVDPKMIIAGQECERTNQFLQLVGLLAAEILSNKKGPISLKVGKIVKVLSTSGSGQNPLSSTKASRGEGSGTVQHQSEVSETKASDNPEQIVRKQSLSKGHDSASQKQFFEESHQVGGGKEDTQRRAHSPKASPDTSAALERPQTARKRPPKIMDSNKVIVAREKAMTEGEAKMANERPSNSNLDPSSQPARAIFMDGEIEDKDDAEKLEHDSTVEQKVEVQDSAFEAVLPKSKLGKQILGEEKERERQVHDLIDSEEKEEQKREQGDQMTLTVNPETKKTLVQLEELRQVVQLLCRHVSPLAKYAECLTEDEQTMEEELEKWQHLYAEQADVLEEEKKKTEVLLNPYQAKLESLERAVLAAKEKTKKKLGIVYENEQRFNEIVNDVCYNI